MRDLFLAATQIELAADGAPPARFRIAAFGKNPTLKGDFILRPEDAQQMVERAKARGIKLSADYEHSALHASVKGGEAPAAAWYDLEVGQDGLYAANVEWTPRAAERLRAREYRYFSPWFGQREDETVASFKNFALTNRPAMDALTPLVASEDSVAPPAPPPEKPRMKTLLKHLLLADDASEAEVLSKVQGLAAERDAFFTATGTKDVPSALAAVETAKRDAAKAKELEAELGKLKADGAKKERQLVLDAAVTDGSIAPNMRDFWASETMSLEQLKAYVAQAPKVGKPADGTQKPKEKDAKEIDLALTDEDKAAAKTLGIAEEDFAKHKKLTLGRVA